MNTAMRSVVLVTALGLCLAGAVPAFATYAPQFAVTSTATGDTIVVYSQSPADDAAAKLQVFVPNDYVAGLADLPGGLVGTVSGSAIAADAGSATQTFQGTIAAAAATTVVVMGGASTTVASAAQACLGSSTASAFWIADFSVAGQDFQLPLYLNQIGPSKLYSDFAGYTLSACLPNPQLAAGAPGRAPGGTKIVSLTVVLHDEFSAAPGWEVWSLLATPYGTIAADASRRVETQAEDRMPQTITLKVAAAPKGKARLVGRLTQGGVGVGHQKVQILNKTTVVATATTNGSGAFVVNLGTPKHALSVKARAMVAVRPLTACVAAHLAPAPCIGTTIGGFTITSSTVTVRSR